MMHPTEEEVSYEVYKKKISTFKLEDFETLYAKNVNQNSLLMSLKLSNDQTRLIRLLKNEAFEDDFYLKIFRLYDWDGEGVYDNDENRDVTITFIKRFFDSDEHHDPATIYSPVSLAKIISQTTDSKLLDTALTMPSYDFNVSKSDQKRATNIKELVAFNPHTSKDTLKKLLNYKDPDIDYFLAQNQNLDADLQDTIYDRSNPDTIKMLALNDSLSDKLFHKLLQNDEASKMLLAFAKIDDERLKSAKKSRYFHIIGENKNISDIAHTLIDIDDLELQKRLASNPAIKSQQLDKIYKNYDDKVIPDLSQNPNLNPDLIKKFFQIKDRYIDITLAANPSTPKKILSEYYERYDDELNLSLAANPSTPIEYLQQFQLDSRFFNLLTKNKTFTDNILNNLGI
jgi:hypothetical protein